MRCIDCSSTSTTLFIALGHVYVIIAVFSLLRGDKVCFPPIHAFCSVCLPTACGGDLTLAMEEVAGVGEV